MRLTFSLPTLLGGFGLRPHHQACGRLLVVLHYSLRFVTHCAYYRETALKKVAEPSDSEVLVEMVTWGTEPVTDGVLRDILLCGPVSKNKRKYTEKGFGGTEKIKGLYEGLPVFMDHGTPDGRSTKDLAGVIKNPRWTESGVRGDIHTVKPYGPALLDMAAAGIRGVGMSHVVLGEVDKTTLVVTVSEAKSVDVVVGPATTKSFKEHTMLPEGQVEALASELTAIRTERDSLKTEVKSLKEKISESATSLATATAKADTLLTEVASLTATCKTATDKLAVLESASQAAEHKKLVLAEVTASGLDHTNPAHLSESLLAILLDLDEPKRKTFLAERSGLFKAAPAAFLREVPGKSSGDFVPGEYSKKFA